MEDLIVLLLYALDLLIIHLHGVIVQEDLLACILFQVEMFLFLCCKPTVWESYNISTMQTLSNFHTHWTTMIYLQSNSIVIVVISLSTVGCMVLLQVDFYCYSGHISINNKIGCLF